MRKTVWLGLVIVFAFISVVMIILTGRTREGNSMETPWTSNQLNVLTTMGVTQDRIEKRSLTAMEEQTLTALAQAEQYLARCYPESEFTFLQLGGPMPPHQAIIFQVREEATQATFEMNLYEPTPPDSAWKITDEFFRLAQAEAVGDYIAALLREGGLTQSAACTILLGQYDDTYHTDQSIAEQVAAGNTYGIRASVFLLDEADAGAAANRVQDILSAHGLAGGVDVYLMKEFPEGKASPDWIWPDEEKRVIEKRFVTVHLTSATERGEE